MYKRKSIFLIIILMMLSFGVFFNASAASISNQDKVNEELDNIVLPSTAIIDFPVTQDSVYGSTIKWESSNPLIINVPTNGGWAEVNRPTDSDTKVTLKVTLTLGDYSNSKNFEVTVRKGTTITNEYNINYVLNGEEVNNPNPSKYHVGDDLVFENPTRNGYEFLGWYDNPMFSGQNVTELPMGTTGDITLYAKWSDKAIESIRVKTNPTKLNYVAFETFDKTGMVIEALYNDSSSKVITDYEVDETTLLTYSAAPVKVEIKYGSFSCEVEINVNKATVNMSGVSFTSKAVTYNGLTQSIEISGVLPTQIEKVVYTEGLVNAGSKLIKASFVLKDSVNYNQVEDMTATLTINKALLSVKVDSVSVKKGTTIPSFTVQYTGFVNGENNNVLGGELVFSCEAAQASPAGTYVISANGLVSDNYEISYVNGVLTISESLLDIKVQTSDLEKVYTGNALSFVAKAYDGATLVNVSLTYTYNDLPFTGAVEVGTYVIKVSYDDSTYGKGEASFEFRITPIQLLETMFGNIGEAEYQGVPVEPTIESSLVLGTDYTVSYTNNNGKGTAQAIITGIGNYSGTITKSFVIINSLEIVKNAAQKLVSIYDGKTSSNLPLTLDGASITWISKSTQVGIDKVTGKVSFIYGEVENSVLLTAIVTKNEAAEYAYVTYIVPAIKVDSTTGVAVEGLESDVDLIVSVVNDIAEIESIISIKDNFSVVVKSYDISLKSNGSEVQPSGSVVVKLPIPEGLTGTEGLKVYYVNNTEAIDMNANIIDGYLVFETTHFSQYVITKENTVLPTGSTIEFVSVESDSSDALTTENALTSIENGENLIASVGSIEKVYLGKDGAKFGSSSVAGKLVITLTSNVTGVRLITNPYNTDTPVVTVNGLEGSDGVYTFTSATDTITITTKTTSKARFYLQSIELVTGAPLPELTDSEKVALDKEALSLANLTVTSDFTLPLAGSRGSVVSWASNNSAIVVNGANAVVTRPLASASDAVVTLTATLTLGEAVETKEFTVTILKQASTEIEVKTIEEFIALPVNNETYYEVTGLVLNLINTTYGNFDLTDPNDLTKKIYVYGVTETKGSTKGKWANLGVNEGDTITIIGTRGEYNGTMQITNAYYKSHVAKVYTDSEKVALDKEALSLANLTVTSGFTLPLAGSKGSTVSWASNNSAIVVNGSNAVVTRPLASASDAVVTLTATLTLGEAVETKEFTITVIKLSDTVLPTGSTIEFVSVASDSSDALTTENALTSIENGENLIASVGSIEKVYLGKDGAKFGSSSVAGKLVITLTSNVTGVRLITNPYNTDTPVVTVNGLEGSDGVYTFTSATDTITITTKTTSKARFYLQSIELVTGAPLPELTDSEKVAYDKEALSLANLTVTSDFTLPLAGSKGSVVSWASNNSAIVVNGSNAVVTRPLASASDAIVTLTATLTSGEAVETKEFTVTVTKLPSSGEDTQKGWVLVTDVNDLSAGDTIVIVAKESDFALGTTQKTNNRSQAAVTKTGNTLTFIEGVQEILLEAGTVANTFAFKVNDGYLYAAGGTGKNNYLKTNSSKTDTGSWTITISDGTASIVANGDVLRNTLMYNKSGSLFSCYASGQQAVSIYKLKSDTAG